MWPSELRLDRVPAAQCEPFHRCLRSCCRSESKTRSIKWGEYVQIGGDGRHARFGKWFYSVNKSRGRWLDCTVRLFVIPKSCRRCTRCWPCQFPVHYHCYHHLDYKKTLTVTRCKSLYLCVWHANWHVNFNFQMLLIRINSKKFEWNIYTEFVQIL